MNQPASYREFAPFPKPEIDGSGTQQLVARIKRSSKYFGQTKPGAWFDVRVVQDLGYGLRGNNNNYRFGDVAFGIRLPNGKIAELGK